MIIQQTLIDLIQNNIVFTDVYIRSHAQLKVRTPAGWVTKTENPLTRDDMAQFLKAVAGPDWENDLKKSETQALDIAKTIGGKARLRCNIACSGANEDLESDYQFIDDVTVTIRKLALTPLEFKDIGLPVRLLNDVLSRKGLWIVTGPTGNGKSTTIASMLQYLNQSQSKHIVTIEQPIEYILRPNKCIISQKEVGQHTPSFNAGLEAAMRQRPDVILIGEVRDAETMNTMLRAGESGHLVLASLHTKNATDAVAKLAGFLEGANNSSKLNTLSSILCGVISQVLLPAQDEKSLVLAYEILMNTADIQAMIRKEEFQKIPNAMATGHREGNILLNACLKELVRNKRITQQVATAAAYDVEGWKKEQYA